MGLFGHDHKKGIAIGLLGAVAFASYVLINRYVYITYDVEAFDYSITVLAAAGLWAGLSLLIRRSQEMSKALHRGSWPILALGLAGGLGVGLTILGQRYTTAVNASIVITSGILTTVLFSKLMLKDSLSRRQKIWVAVMFVGLYLGIVGAHLIDFNSGDIIIFISTAVLSYATVLSKTLMSRYSSHFLAEARLLLSGLMFVVLGLVLSGSSVIVSSAGLWPLLAGLSFWLAVKLFYAAVRLLGANLAIVLANSQLVFASIGGVLLLTETYNWIKFVGSAIVLASIYSISKK